MEEIQFPNTICIYQGTDPGKLALDGIKDYLSSRLGKIKVELRRDIMEEFFESLPAEHKEDALQKLAARLAQAKVHDVQRPHTDREPLYGEVEFEKKWLLNQAEKPFGLLYDGFRLQRIYFDLLPERERNLGVLHIVLTKQLFGTRDMTNGRYHARVSLYGFPCILSFTGLVEALAKPREYYLERKIGANHVELKKKFAGRFLDHDDPQLTEAMKGYLIQALFYYVLGDPFCEDNHCRLFNAHWQEDLIRAQLGGDYEFCELHKKVLDQMR